jgi:hypothetical protein
MKRIGEIRTLAVTSVLTRATQVIFQKTPFFVVTAVKNSQLTEIRRIVKVHGGHESIIKKCSWHTLRRKRELESVDMYKYEDNIKS